MRGYVTQKSVRATPRILDGKSPVLVFIRILYDLFSVALFSRQGGSTRFPDVWNTTKFETHLKTRIKEEFNDEKAEQMFSAYKVARGKLVDDIYEQIIATQPNLSDHGPKHIANVLNNVGYLLSDSHSEYKLSASNLYVLAMGVLFHDVGNFYDREDHHKKIGAIFDSARGKDAEVRREKTLVMKLAMAHTGVAMDGTKDTLKDVGEIDHLEGESIQLRSIAAILRFADELAEGPQRTSEFRRKAGLYGAESKIYHDYASVTNVGIDRPNQRILLTYEIDLDENGAVRNGCETWLQDFLAFIYGRVIKLEQERRYARFYSNVLQPFKATHVAFNFHYKGSLLPIDLPPLWLDDKIVPGEQAKDLPEIDSRYTISQLVGDVLRAATEETIP